MCEREEQPVSARYLARQGSVCWWCEILGDMSGLPRDSAAD